MSDEQANRQMAQQEDEFASYKLCWHCRKFIVAGEKRVAVGGCEWMNAHADCMTYISPFDKK